MPKPREGQPANQREEQKYVSCDALSAAPVCIAIAGAALGLKQSEAK